MGEIAEMMLDGTLCECCGSYIDIASGAGVPRYCSPQCGRDRGRPNVPVAVNPATHERPSRFIRAMRWLEQTAASSGVEKQRAPEKLAWLAKQGLVSVRRDEDGTRYFITELGRNTLANLKAGS